MKLGSVLTCLVGSAVLLLSAPATDPKVTFVAHDKSRKAERSSQHRI
jgi:hypothetical protein